MTFGRFRCLEFLPILAKNRIRFIFIKKILIFQDAVVLAGFIRDL